MGLVVLAGVVLAQEAGWIRPLAEEYSRVYKAAYDEAQEEGLADTGREVVAEQVLYAYIATRSPSSSAGGGSPQPGGGSGGGGTPHPGDGGSDQTTPTPGPSPTPTPTPTPTPGPSPTPTATPTPEPDRPPTFSDIDGHSPGYRVDVSVLSTGVTVSMHRRNAFTIGGSLVRVKSDGTLTTSGISGLHLADRYWWFCDAGSGNPHERWDYASDEYNASLPKTGLDNASLVESDYGKQVIRICNGDEEPPTKSWSRYWGRTDGMG